MSRRQSIYIGFDSREAAAFAVCRDSVLRHLNPSPPIHVRGLVLDDLRERGLYTRETEKRLGADGAPWLFDVISQHSMATEFAISRFLIGLLAGEGYALFMDCDMLVRTSLRAVFDHCEGDRSKAVWCVKHHHVPDNLEKMDGQTQSIYARKNWTSFMVWNVDHEANKALTPEIVNRLPGRDLHRLCWLRDDEIGELDVSWNWLVNVSPDDVDPKVVHFTDGGPWFKGYEDVPYADEWRSALNRWAA